VIVRIATEGQYEVSDEQLQQLNELDNALVAACQAGDEQQFKDRFASLLELVRSNGSPIAEDDLRGSDLILPPPDTSIAEATADFSGEGLIPG
jgi:hypothetical protein